jgi:hypothetical protein
MNVVITQAITVLARLLIGSDAFARILGAVERWADKEVESAKKRNGVLAELEIIGLGLCESLVRLGVELAVTVVKRKAA